MVVEIALERFKWLSYRSEELCSWKESWLDIRVESMVASDRFVGENDRRFEKYGSKSRWIAAAVRAIVRDCSADSIFVAVSFENCL